MKKLAIVVTVILVLVTIGGVTWVRHADSNARVAAQAALDQKDALAGLAFGLREAGNLDEAIKVAPYLESELRGEQRPTSDPDTRLSHIVTLELSNGRTGPALEAARSMESSSYKAFALARIAEADPDVLAEAKQAAKAALRECHNVTGPTISLAKTLAYRGDLEGAKKLVRENPLVSRDVHVGDFTFYEVKGLIDRGEVDAAMARMDTTLHPSDRVTLLLRVAEKTASNGNSVEDMLARSRAAAATMTYDLFRVGVMENRLGKPDPETAKLVYADAARSVPALLPQAGYLLTKSGQDRLAEEAFQAALEQPRNANSLAYYLTLSGREGDARRIAGL